MNGEPPRPLGYGVPPRRRSNAATRDREWMTEAEVAKLCKAAARTGENGHRNMAMILIGFRHGLRVTELIGLKWESIDLDRKTLFARRLKGSKSNIHTMERDEVAALRKLHPKRAGLVFTSERHGMIGRRTFLAIIAEAGEKADLPFSVHPHMLRHSCGYCLTAAGHPTRMIQEWLGHRNIQHTVRYTELDPDRFRAAGMWSKERKTT